MKDNLILVKNKGTQWFQNEEGSIFVKGYLFENDNLLDGLNLINRLEHLNTTAEIQHFIQEANGLFSIIFKKFNAIILITDRLRTFPLFYTSTDQHWWVSDFANELIPHLKETKVNRNSKNEFLGFGLVSGNKTLMDGIFQVKAGSIAIIKNPLKIEEVSYHDYLIKSFSNLNFEQTKHHLKEAFFTSAQRVLQSIGDRPVVLQLSGGLDSRLVACLLKKLGHQNVSCVTYGRKDSHDVKLAEKVANQLGFSWTYIEYNEALIKGYLQEKVFQEYYPFASNLTSMFFMQEYFAVRQLKQQHLIAENAVFLSGFGGEMEKGDYIFETPFKDLKDVAKRILMKTYDYALLDKQVKTKFIQDFIEQEPGYILNSYLENWFLKEVQAKLIQNSAQVWNFFGHQFRTILWDKEILEILKGVDYEFKNHGRLYLAAVREIYEEFGVNFPETYTTPPELKRKQEKKDGLKYEFQFLRKLKNYRADDSFFYKEITAAMEEEMKQSGHKYELMKGYNSIIIQWYLFKLNLTD